MTVTTSVKPSQRTDRSTAQGTWISGLRQQVDNWFRGRPLSLLLNREHSPTEDLAVDWLAGGGNRWRPLLVAAASQALSENTRIADVRQLAIAVECLHKASLIHDDIEDGDLERDGRPTMHARHGIPIALNIGDYLIGEAYRLIAQLPVPAETNVRLLQTTAEGHCQLSLGQGAELWWTEHPGPLSVDDVIQIAGRKTAPGFAVGLCLGAVLAGADEVTIAAVARFGRNLGIAYQIQDDIHDFAAGRGLSDLRARRPSLMLALCCELGSPRLRTLLTTPTAAAGSWTAELAELTERLQAHALWHLTHYRHAARQSIAQLPQPVLRDLLQELTAFIFTDEPAPASSDREHHRPLLSAAF